MKTFSKYSVLISTLALCGLLLVFLNNLRPELKQTEENYSRERAVNLSKDLSSEELSAILLSNNYVANQREANLIADTITARLNKGLEYPNLYYLQKRAYGKIPALVADSACVFEKRLKDSYKSLGLLDINLPASTNSLDSEIRLHKDSVNSYYQGERDAVITAYVYEEHKESRGRLLNALLGTKKCKIGQPGVLVRLIEYRVDGKSLFQDTVFAKTDSAGYACFSYLDRSCGYSILPIKKGFEYGTTKGVRASEFKKYKFKWFWKNDYTYEFEQLEHRIQLISNAKLKQIKDDDTITVRTPAEFKAVVVKWFILVMLSWWILSFIMVYRKRNFDPLIIASAMFLSCLCIIMMFAIQDPLTEDMKGVEMASGVLVGIMIIFALQFVDFIKFYQDNYKITFDPTISVLRWLFLPYKQKISLLAEILSGDAQLVKKLGAMFLLVLSLPFALIFNFPYMSKINKPILRFIEKLPKGFGWLLLAIMLTALLFTPLGKEIGGMKVNLSLLGLTFQPSEIAKYLIIFFMAAFFTSTADSIIAYSQPYHTNIWNKFKTLAWLLVGMVVLMVIYAGLGDLGPALVVGITFVILYSLVKSKVNLDNLENGDKWHRIFTCDFAMLIYGVVSFAIFMIIGAIIDETFIFAFAVLWFVAWIIWGISNNKQFFETAFIINLLIFVFIFGGKIAKDIPYIRDTDVAERFEQRTKMCYNTWGDLEKDEPVSNTQVANGLWAIATGGMTGQGLGDGNPNLIPAFHTDMILSSIAEQIGWIGLVFVVVVLALLLRRITVVGYRVGHPFAFYFCIGVSIVTAIQFFIIALGSSGMIPLTGITVPFLSYGKVSMILNLTAVGVVLSLSKNIKSDEELTAVQGNIRQRSVYDYNFPVSIVTWTYIIIALFTLCAWQYYALWARDKTLIHPAYVHNNEGVPIIEYNPRITLLTKQMWAGDICDRKGRLLATSNPEKIKGLSSFYADTLHLVKKETLDKIYEAKTHRYYPFGEHLFFMLGDLNKGLLTENDNVGYMAEMRHLSYLRNYDTQKRDKKGKVLPRLVLTGKTPSKHKYYYMPAQEIKDTITERDYSDLKKYLKDGIYGDEIKDHNKKVAEGKYDITLTIDAELQIKLQKALDEYCKKNYNNHLLRVSVVVLDAKDGDCIASAIFPLPNYSNVMDLWDSKKSYRDQGVQKDWKAFSDCDLGLAYPTPPGSTAKIMSAMAGLNKLGASKGSNTKYDIQQYEAIDYNEGKPAEPPFEKNHEVVDMNRAIVISSNCYFINLVNEENLYEELEKIYAQTGVSVGGNYTYKLMYPEKLSDGTIHQYVVKQEDVALNKWEKYKKEKAEGLYVNWKDVRTMWKGDWMWAWGQGTMDATPLTMARVVSAVVNDGKMPETRFITTQEKKSHSITNKENANYLKTFMKHQYEYQSERGNLYMKPNIGGKTGTPHRSYANASGVSTNINDGWYVFYIDNSNKEGHSLSVAVRMERVGKGGSVHPMILSREIIIPLLENYNTNN